MSTAKLFEYLTAQGYTGSLADKENAYWTDMLVNNGDPDFPLTGECVPGRELWVSTTSAASSGTILLNYFTARRTESITTLTTYTSSTAAAATPTLCKVGVYSVATNGDLTLVSSCTNDTTLWASTNSSYAATLSSTFSKTVGRRYALANLCVTAGALPTHIGLLGAGSHTGISTAWALSPRLHGAVTGQTDLPASIGNASVVNSTPRRVAFALS